MSQYFLDNVTFLQICKDMGLVVFKKQVTKSVVQKLLGGTHIVSVSSPKDVRDTMGEVTFSYGSLLNKKQKMLANSAENYAQTVQQFSKTTFTLDDDPKFTVVYNIITSAETVEEGVFKAFEECPLRSDLIHHSLRRLKLEKEEAVLKQKEKQKEEYEKIVWRPWQESLLKELNGTPDNRKIIWYYDPRGHRGKSFFARWQGLMDKNTVVVGGKEVRNIHRILAKRTDVTKTVIVDTIKCYKFGIYKIDYELIQNVKDGFFYSEEHEMTSIPIPHLVVFANYKPDIETMSKDRWDIRVLSDREPAWFCSPSEVKNVYRSPMCRHEIFFCKKCCNHPLAQQPCEICKENKRYNLCGNRNRRYNFENKRYNFEKEEDSRDEYTYADFCEIFCL